MSWKLCTVAIVLFGLCGSSLTAGEQSRANDNASRQNTAPAVTSAQFILVAAAKQPSDKELIEKQKTCPVTDQPLGSMGKPVKVVVKKHTVFLCCAGCKKKLMANPDKYLKKLDETK